MALLQSMAALDRGRPIPAIFWVSSGVQTRVQECAGRTTITTKLVRDLPHS